MNHSQGANSNPIFNKHTTKVLVFLFFFSVFVFVLAFRLGHRWGLFLALVILAALYLIAFLLPPRFLEEKFDLSDMGGKDPWGINSYLAQLFLPLQENPPQVFIFDSNSVNAFLTSRPFHAPRIYLSRAFLEKLSEKEIKAALTILCSRLLHQNDFKESLAGLIRQIVSGLGENLDHALRTHIFAKVLTPVSRLVGKILFSEKAIYRYDKWAAEATEDKALVADVLRKLYAYSLTLPLQVPRGSEQDFIVTPDPLAKNHLPLHVSVEKRLVQLQGIYPN